MISFGCVIWMWANVPIGANMFSIPLTKPGLHRSRVAVLGTFEHLDPKASHALAPKRPDSPTAKGSTARAVYWSQLPAESAWATQSPIAGCGTWKCTGNQVVKEYWRSLYWLGVFLSINHGFGLGDKDPNPTQTLPGLVETYAFCQGGFGKTRRDHKPLLRFLRFSEIQWVQEWTFVTTEVCANPGHQVDVCANWFGRAG